MSFENPILLELIKFGFSLGLLLVTWIFGQRIISDWDARKKQRELDIITTAQFQQLYGEFKEIGRLWKIFLRKEDKTLTFPENTRWILLERAVVAESKIEAIFVKISTERNLSLDNLKQLGLLRQCFQQLRQTIRDNEELVFSEHGPEYDFFNSLASKVACLVASGKQIKSLDSEKAIGQLKAITDVRSKHLEAELNIVRALPNASSESK